VKALRRDPILMALMAVTLTAFALFTLFEGDQVRQSQAFWCAQVPMDAALAYGAWRLRALVPHYRRFWSAIAFASMQNAVSDTHGGRRKLT